jgi:tRNA (guanine-N7-)-methyltransferase
VEEPLPAGALDLERLFGNRRLVELEVGPGKGAFLLARARRRPEINVLAVEWVPRYACYAADRAHRAGLENVRVIRADAETVFRSHLADGSLWRVHIHFPDPWPKVKHHRRRLIKPAFARDVHRTLRIGGWVGVVTDHADYFGVIARVFGAERGLATVPFAPAAGLSEGLVGTNFERKYASKGRRLFALARLRYR